MKIYPYHPSLTMITTLILFALSVGSSTAENTDAASTPDVSPQHDVSNINNKRMGMTLRAPRERQLGRGSVSRRGKGGKGGSYNNPYCIKMYYGKGKGGKGGSSSKSSKSKKKRRRRRRGKGSSSSQRRGTGRVRARNRNRQGRNVFRNNRNYQNYDRDLLSEGDVERHLSSYSRSKGGYYDSHYYDYSDEWYYDDPACYTRFPTFVPDPVPTTSPRPSSSLAPSSTPDINFRNGFPCDDSPFTLNRNPSSLAFPQLLVIDAANDPNLCFLRMSNDVVEPEGLAATAFLDFTFDPTNTQRIFSMSIGYRIFGPNAGAADGMAFILHQDPRGLAAIGQGGGNLGVYDKSVDTTTDTGIKPALVIEWDTIENVDDVEVNDDSSNHIHIQTVNSAGDLTELLETTGVTIRTSDTGSPTGRMWVDYCGDNILKVYINNAGDTKPATPQAEVPFDMNTLFTGQSFVTGYSASTGAEADFHDITGWELTESCSDT